jgi:hypothetical protein
MRLSKYSFCCFCEYGASFGRYLVYLGLDSISEITSRSFLFGLSKINRSVSNIFSFPVHGILIVRMRIIPFTHAQLFIGHESFSIDTKRLFTFLPIQARRLLIIFR